MNKTTSLETLAANPLRGSKWAMSRLGYLPEQRVAFWQFCASNAVPMVRLSARRIMFDERQLEDFINRRSTVRAVLS